MFLRWDPLNNKWEYVASMHCGRFGHKAVDFHGKIYVFGGTDKNFKYLKSFEVYDPNENTWKIISLSHVSKITYVSI